MFKVMLLQQANIKKKFLVEKEKDILELARMMLVLRLESSKDLMEQKELSLHNKNQLVK